MRPTGRFMTPSLEELFVVVVVVFEFEMSK